MYAIRQHAFGPAENLRYEEVEDPQPGEGQVRIAVAAAGVHVVDTMIRSGATGGPFAPPELPMTPGREVAGIVDALGAGVDRAWLGRRVVAHLGMASGGYAQLAVANVTSLHALPGGLGFEAAVAMIGTGRTTMGILEVAQLRPDDVVLIPAAAGGIGSLLVQAARNVGATVVALAGGPTKIELVKKLGADIAVDYREPGWEERVRAALGEREVTVALDGVGGDVGRSVLELIGLAGRLAIFGWSSGTPTELTTSDLYERGITPTVVIGPRMLRRPGGLRSLEEQALAEAAAERLAPAVQTFPLAKAAEAHVAIEARATVGKVVLLAQA